MQHKSTVGYDKYAVNMRLSFYSISAANNSKLKFSMNINNRLSTVTLGIGYIP